MSMSMIKALHETIKDFEISQRSTPWYCFLEHYKISKQISYYHDQLNNEIYLEEIKRQQLEHLGQTQ